MAKLFGSIEESELDDLPEPVKEAIKAASSDSDKLKALEAEVAALKAKKTTEGEGEGEDGIPPQPIASKWNPAVSPLEEINFNTAQDVLLMRILSNDTDLVNRGAVKLFDAEIRGELQKSHPRLRADEKYVRNIVDLVKGRHLAEIVAYIKNPTSESSKNYNSLFVESGGGNNPPVPPVKNPVDSLTAEERAAANRFGMTLEDYAKSKEALANA